MLYSGNALRIDRQEEVLQDLGILFFGNFVFLIWDRMLIQQDFICRWNVSYLY